MSFNYRSTDVCAGINMWFELSQLLSVKGFYFEIRLLPYYFEFYQLILIFSLTNKIEVFTF